MAKNRFTVADIAGRKIVGGVGHKAAAKAAPSRTADDARVGDKVWVMYYGKRREGWIDTILTPLDSPEGPCNPMLNIRDERGSFADRLKTDFGFSWGFIEEEPVPKKNKFGAIKVPDEETGKLIDSKQEAKDRAKYRVMLRSGEIALYAPQPEVIAATGIVYRGDHLVIRMVDGAAEIEIADSKGMETPEFKLKWKLVTEKFPQFKWTKLSSRKPKPSKPKSVKPKKR